MELDDRSAHVHRERDLASRGDRALDGPAHRLGCVSGVDPHPGVGPVEHEVPVLGDTEGVHGLDRLAERPDAGDVETGHQQHVRSQLERRQRAIVETCRGVHDHVVEVLGQ
jgi:hypothetical protein